MSGGIWRKVANAFGMFSQARIEVAYDGESLASGSMDVRDLAPALLALGGLLEDANQIINGDDTRMSVRVRSDFRTGSFDVTLDVVQSLSNQVALLLQHERSYTAAEVALSLGIGADSVRGVLQLIKALKGREPKRTVKYDDGRTKIEMGDDDEGFFVNDRVLLLHGSERVKEGFRKLVAPVARDGIDSFDVRVNGVTVERVTKDELPYFRTKDDIENTRVTSSDAIVEIVAPIFREKRKWEFQQGAIKFHATISDESFAQKVESGGLAFAKGDRLRVELLTRERDVHGELKFEYEIVKVIEVVHERPRQG